MALSIKDSPKYLFRWLFIYNLLGTIYLKFGDFCSLIWEFIFGHCGTDSDVQRLILEGKNMDFIYRNEMASFERFKHFCMERKVPMSAIFASTLNNCRLCGRELIVDSAWKTIVVYHMTRGTYLGCRVTKRCGKCKVFEHYGFSTRNSTRTYNSDFLCGEFFVSSEDTAIDLSFLKYFKQEFVLSAMPFKMKANIYNAFHQYDNYVSDEDSVLRENTECIQKMGKRKSMCLEKLLEERLCLDRRRLEEAFILYAVIETCNKYGISIPSTFSSRNDLLENICNDFHQAFVERWSKHRCKTPGCGKVLVLDGNLKNARQVCCCKAAGVVKFSSLGGKIAVGCPNSPVKGSRLCSLHKNIATKFTSDSPNTESSIPPETNKEEEYVVMKKVWNQRQSRQGYFYEVLWSDGRVSWVKGSKLPGDILSLQGKDLVDVVGNVKFGKHLFLSKRSEHDTNGDSLSNIGDVKSDGFAILNPDDSEIHEDGKIRNLTCGTEKDKQKAKNCKTAGCLVMNWPCGVAIDFQELFGSEGKAQVYGHIHTILERDNMNDTGTIVYDDACHLLKFARNPVRYNLSTTSARIAKMEIVCDRFHFRNHVDKWCRKMCNPDACEGLRNVNTEVCEQTFSWMSQFSKMSKHMNRWRFLFFMLYILDQHNELVVRGLKNKKTI